MSFAIFTVHPGELRQLACPPRWCFFQWFLVCFCKHWIFTLWKPHVWICLWPKSGLLLLVDLSCWLWFLKFSFWWCSLKMFSTGPWSLSQVCFSLGFTFCAMLHCSRHERGKCDSFSAVPICKICAYSGNESAFCWSRNIWIQRWNKVWAFDTGRAVSLAEKSLDCNEVYRNFWRRKNKWKKTRTKYVDTVSLLWFLLIKNKTLAWDW